VAQAVKYVRQYNIMNKNWGLLEKIQGFVFDTTASYSGRLNGACVLLEQQ